MRISVLALILTGFACGPMGLAAGQQHESTQSEMRPSRNLLGDVKLLDEFERLGFNYASAFNRNDAAAMAAFYANDGIAVTPDGWFSGHEAIQQWYQFMFQRWQPSHSLWQLDRLTGTDNEALGIGHWWGTVQTQKGPVSASGLWSTEYIRVGNDWKIRSAAFNVSGGIPLTVAADTGNGQ